MADDLMKAVPEENGAPAEANVEDASKVAPRDVSDTTPKPDPVEVTNSAVNKEEATNSGANKEEESVASPSVSSSSSGMDTLTAKALQREMKEGLAMKRAPDTSTDEEDYEPKERSGFQPSPCPTPSSSAAAVAAASAQGCQRNEEGYLLWGRVRGFSYWPAVVTVDPEDGMTIWEADHEENVDGVHKYHVHFLAYENQRAWLPERAIMEFKGMDAYNKLASTAKGPKKKEFFPTAKRQRQLFDKAVELAEQALALPPNKRLEMLGYVYVLIEPKKKAPVKTKAARKTVNAEKKSSPSQGASAGGPTRRKRKRMTNRKPSNEENIRPSFR